MSGFENLLSVIKILISENGCPWDKVQTPLSLRQYMIEECFETIDAITQGDKNHIKEELGDLFFNVLLDACIFERDGDFTVDECLNEISQKLIRRHPHVFAESEGKIESNSDLNKQWESIKKNVEGRKEKCTLDSVPDGFPPLLKANKMLKKASKTGFEWQNIEQVRSKVLEELDEVKEAEADLKNDKSQEKQNHLEEEVGDLLLSVVNYARWLDIDPSTALSRANKKFKKRFDFVESSMKQAQIPMDENHLNEMMNFWNEAKKQS